MRGRCSPWAQESLWHLKECLRKPARRPWPQVGFKPTGRTCSRAGCVRARLYDSILDWEDALPEDELQETERQADQAVRPAFVLRACYAFA